MKRRGLFLAVTLNVIAIIALAYSLGWLDLLKFGKSSSNTTQVTESGTGGASMSLDIFDEFPDMRPPGWKPYFLRIVPTETLIEPGQSITFTPQLVQLNSRLMEETTAEFSVEGPGTITSSGVFEANVDAIHQTAKVTARGDEDLEGDALVRIVPPLPWEFAFDDLANPPNTWKGGEGRYVVRDLDGGKVLVNVLSAEMRSGRCWFGSADLSNYTIQADVRGATADDKMPDIGIIAQGYTLDLQGTRQKLQLRTCDSRLRSLDVIDFSWKPDTWYVMKLQAQVDEGKAVLKGKVWPRGEEEPQPWTIEVPDEAEIVRPGGVVKSASTSGSPGLYGNTVDAEIFLNNIKVTSN